MLVTIILERVFIIFAQLINITLPYVYKIIISSLLFRGKHSLNDDKS